MRKVKLGEITDSCLGKMLDAQKNKGEYQPYLANINVRWGYFDLDNLSQMRFEEHEQERYGLKYGDLVICEGGEPGRCAIWRDEAPNMKIQKALHRVRPRSNLDIRFLYYWFLLAGQKKWLNKYFIETTIKHLPGDKLKDIEIDLPSIENQNSIADVLSSLDEKIHLNSRIITELEDMANTIYKYWFVQFDFPNKNDKPYRLSGGEMVWNAQLKRDIPKGWTAETLNSILQINKIAFNPSHYADNIVEHYSIPAYDGGLYPVFEPASNIGSGKYRISKDDILVSKLNPQFKRIWDPYCITDMTICSTEFIPYSCIKKEIRPFGYALLNSDRFFKFMSLNASSSTGSRKRLTPEDTLGFKFAMPEHSILSMFIAQYKPILNMVKKYRIENHELTKLRDWLLPLLMNGQVAVK